MGALTPARRQATETRYTNLEGVGEDSIMEHISILP
jgi:hypothetical protein